MGRIFSSACHQEEINEAFQVFMGRTPVGKVRLSLKMDFWFNLTIADDHGERVFPIKQFSEATNYFSLLDEMFGCYYIGIDGGRQYMLQEYQDLVDPGPLLVLQVKNIPYTTASIVIDLKAQYK